MLGKGRRRETVPVRLIGELSSKAERTYAVLARAKLGAGTVTAVPLENQCSSLVANAAHCNALLLLPPGTRTYESGASLPGLIIGRSTAAKRREPPA